MSWQRLKLIVEEKTGLFLSPFPYRTRLENYRGMYLYFRGNRDEILLLMQHYKPSLVDKASPVEHSMDKGRSEE